MLPEAVATNWQGVCIVHPADDVRRVFTRGVCSVQDLLSGAALEGQGSAVARSWWHGAEPYHRASGLVVGAAGFVRIGLMQRCDEAYAGDWRWRMDEVLFAGPADFNVDGALDVFDFLAFQNAFASMDLAADFDADGVLTIFDFLAFFNAFGES